MANKEQQRELLLLLDKISRYTNSRKSITDDLTFGESRVLTYIGRSTTGDVMSLSTLADETMLAPSALSQMLRVLERRGYVVREPSPEDRRAVLVALTEEGRELADKIQEKLDESMNELLDIYGEEDSKEFIRLLKIAADYQEKFMGDDN